MERLAQDGGSVYLLGGRPGIAEKAAGKLKQRFPTLRIAGVTNGYFSSEQERDVVQRISDARADLLLVGMGCPRQESFISQYRRELNVPVMIGVGGSLDIFAGAKSLAPRWVRRAGFEWLFRVLMEPARFRRSLVLPKFIQLVMNESRRRAHDKAC
jgi:N-acetylglucosaminyldiphosphoundecaprenol N-acetyl-beta-D-mannosaminyltransferase